MQKPLLAAVLSLAVLAPVHAQSVRTERNMSLELANQLAAAGVAACQEKGFAVTVTVVDRAGTVRAVQRADNAGPHTFEGSRAKAYTSASAKSPTQAILERSQKDPSLTYLSAIPGFLLLGGGVPVKVGNEVIGAVGISGAPAGTIDEQCAMAAIDKAKDALK